MERSITETLHVETIEPEPLIVVKDAYKRYSPSAVILYGLNMIVNKGTIYSLLGPSGCGKTTLLACLTGRKLLDAGSIKVNLKSKLLLGYMPQEISLYEDLSIHETLMYFGLLMNKDKNDILIRKKELTALLDLPPCNRIIETLSGGQQRRISMAVAILHDPELLILDEPTAGLDPVLANDIWSYFLKISNEDHKTIIITTHYIEEAKNSYTIGLMRNGVILAEMNPIALITSMNCSSLEEAFLILSQKQEKHTLNINDYPASNNKKSERPFNSKESFCTYRFKAQLYKNITWTKRNILVTHIILALPSVLFIILMGMLSGNLNYAKIGVINDELIPGVDDCNVTNKIVSEYGCVTSVRLSCGFILYLKNNLSTTLIEFKNMNDSIDALKKNKVWAVLYFHKNYSEALFSRIENGTKASSDVINRSAVEVYSDNSVFHVAYDIKKKIVIGLRKYLNTVLKNCQIHEKVVHVPPIRVNPPIYEGFDIRFTPLNGYALSILLYLAYVYTSSAMAYEKNTGIMERTIISGLTMNEIAVAHSCIQILICVCQNAVVYYIIYHIFNLKLLGSSVLLGLLFFLAEFCGMAIGFLVVEFVSLDALITYFGVTLVITLFISIGMLWPAEGLHWSIKWLNMFNPVKKAVTTYDSLQNRRLSFTNPLIYEGYLYLSISLLLLSIACWIKMRNS